MHQRRAWEGITYFYSEVGFGFFAWEWDISQKCHYSNARHGREGEILPDRIRNLRGVGSVGGFRKNNNQAERVSDEAGHKYQDRHGEWRNDTVKDMTGLALIAWCKHKGVEYV